MKRWGIIAVVATLAVAVALGGTRSHSASAQTGGGERTIQLTLVKGFFHLVDEGKRGHSPGDVQIFGGRLVSNGQTRGKLQAYCVVVTKSNQECSFTYALDGGQIASMPGFGKGLSAGRSSIDPIVGGTGPFEGARGQISGTEVGPRTDMLTIHLVG
jgi:hypothetical protein